MSYTSDKLTKNLVRSLRPGRHSDGGGLYLVVDPSGARRWIVRVTIKGQRNREENLCGRTSVWAALLWSR